MAWFKLRTQGYEVEIPDAAMIQAGPDRKLTYPRMLCPGDKLFGADEIISIVEQPWADHHVGSQLLQAARFWKFLAYLLMIAIVGLLFVLFRSPIHEWIRSFE